MTTLRDALQVQRLNTMRRRSAEAQAKARRDSTELQQGFMAVIRGIAQPSTF